MPISEELTWDDVSGKLVTPLRILLREIFAAKAVYDDLINDQGGLTDLAFGRILFETTDTKSTTLIIDATAKTISCRTGANLFANIRVGRNLQMTSFTNGGNNQTTEITSKISNDSIGINIATGLVDETDTAARAQENPEQYELDKIAKLHATKTILLQIYDDFVGGTPTTSDKAALARDFI